MSITLAPAHEKAFRQAMSCFPTGVSVITLGAPERIGVTISSLVSVSLDPLLVLFCLSNASQSHKPFLRAAQDQQTVGITVLAQGQEAVSDRFTRHSIENWSTTALLPQEASDAPPLLSGGAAYLTGIFEHTYPGGDHTLFVCRVTSCVGMSDVAPLVYVHSGYRGGLAAHLI
jgi:flavin reductase (DIM6/NTAB) family NADH-FMN oxidoreductase RutF